MKKSANTKIFLYVALFGLFVIFTPQAIKAYCGDAIFEPLAGETCEMTVPSYTFPAGCNSTTCTASPGWICDGTCAPICGDSQIVGPEVCDSGVNNGKPHGFVIPPTRQGFYDTTGYSTGVTVSGNYAYVADASAGLQIINISNPSSPNLVSTYNTPGAAFNVAISGNYAYVADYNGGLQIINVSNPANPSLAGSYPTIGAAIDVVISGNYAYVAAYSGGLQIINISNPASPSLVGTYDTPSSATGISKLGNYAYVADYDSGLQIINVSNPANPTWVGEYDTPAQAFAVVAVGNYAYVADTSSGLQIINISNPANPSLTGVYDTPLSAVGINISGYNVYITDLTNGLLIIDVTNPTTPILTTSYDTVGTARDVFISGDYAYVADYGSGLQIIHVKLSGQTNYCNSTCSGTNPSVCNNAFIEQSETCDDGPYNGLMCVPQYGINCTYCNNSCTQSTVAGTYCGDGTVNGPEICDDGNTVTENCAYGLMSCTVCGATCTNVPGTAIYCGDNVINGSESCDDGNTVTESCAYGQMSCSVCGATCQNVTGAATYCGDGDINGFETCDSGDAKAITKCAYGLMSCTVCNDSTCQNMPGTTSYCGDGTINGPEVCDDGNTVTENCAYSQMSCTVCGSACANVSGAVAYCGDHIVNGTEQCDYDSGVAIAEAGDGCSSTCQEEPGYICYGEPNFCIFHCGDEVLQTESPFNEQCDEGIPGKINPVTGLPATAPYNNDKCSASEYGETCDWCSSGCQIETARASYCGDGVKDEPYESCDDGNLENGDGCSNCQVDLGYQCPGIYSVCTTVCGDGVCAAGAETCLNCSNDCQICSVSSPTPAPAHDQTLFEQFYNSFSSFLTAPTLRIKIPGLNFEEEQTATTPVETKDFLIKEGEKTKIDIGGESIFITIEPEDADGNIHYIIE